MPRKLGSCTGPMTRPAGSASSTQAEGIVLKCHNYIGHTYAAVTTYYYYTVMAYVVITAGSVPSIQAECAACHCSTGMCVRTQACTHAHAHPVHAPRSRPSAGPPACVFAFSPFASPLPRAFSVCSPLACPPRWPAGHPAARPCTHLPFCTCQCLCSLAPVHACVRLHHPCSLLAKHVCWCSGSMYSGWPSETSLLA